MAGGIWRPGDGAYPQLTQLRLLALHGAYLRAAQDAMPQLLKLAEACRSGASPLPRPAPLPIAAELEAQAPPDAAAFAALLKRFCAVLSASSDDPTACRLRVGLSRPGFVPVIGQDGARYYGGDQNWTAHTRPDISATGCGVVALVDLGFYLAGTAEIPKADYLARLREALRHLHPPVLLPGVLARAARQLSTVAGAQVLRSRRATLDEALGVVAASLMRDTPVPLQVLRTAYGKCAGAEKVIPWHWTTITALELPLFRPEETVYTYATWGTKREGRFANVWRGRGPLQTASLVLAQRTK